MVEINVSVQTRSFHPKYSGKYGCCDGRRRCFGNRCSFFHCHNIHRITLSIRYQNGCNGGDLCVGVDGNGVLRRRWWRSK